MRRVGKKRTIAQMTSDSAHSAGLADVKSLSEAITHLRSAQSPDARNEAARWLLETARGQCGGDVDVAELTEAAGALASSLEHDTGEVWIRQPLMQTVHQFIDLARSRAVRRAAFPADGGEPGALWLARVIELIDRSDFTVGSMFRQRATQYADKSLFIVPRGDRVTNFSWKHVHETTRRIASGILARSSATPVAALFTPNRVEGALFDLACLTNGIFVAVVPANAVESQFEHIIVESGATMVAASGPEQLRMALAAQSRFPNLEWIIVLDPLRSVPGAGIISLDQLEEAGDAVAPDLLVARAAGVRSADVATTMYTSGTTGVPKGIKFSHLNLVSKRFARAAALPEIDENEVFLCYLPLYHTFGRFLEMLGAAHLGATYVFAENSSTDTLIRHLRQLCPTAMISVPKKWLDLYERITCDLEPPADPTRLHKAVRSVLGERLRWGLSAAGHLDPAIFRFFHEHEIDLLSGYGMTEATGGITMTQPGQYREDSIGRLLPALECRMGDDGELMLRGPYITRGYTNPQDNLASFRDGWLCTGDIVGRDSDGHFRIVDRKKDIYKNARGRTVAPQRVEALFADFPEIERVFAVGDGREYVTLLIRPNVANLEGAFDKMSDATLREYFRELVVACNRFLAPFERVVNFALIDRDFSLDRNELTPKGSFRRAVVEKNFRTVIEPMYAASSIERIVDGLHIKIPVSFLQHLGATETGVQSIAGGLVFRAIGKTLFIRRDPVLADRIWLGNCCYDAVEPVIELDNWLRLPKLWVGNAELTDLTGDSILRWSLAGEEQTTPIHLVCVEPPGVGIEAWCQRLGAPDDTTPALLTVHAAVVAMIGGTHKVALRALDLLEHALKTGRIRHQELVESRLQYASTHHDVAVRSRAFALLVAHQKGESFAKTARTFCGSLLSFLDEATCRRLGEMGITPRQWRLFARAMSSARRSVAAGGSAGAVRFAVELMHALAQIANVDPHSYLFVRHELTAWMLAPVPRTIRNTAAKVHEALTAAFRRRLGDKQERATDPRTGKGYTWGDTLQFEDGIHAEEAERIAEALQQTELIREAVFLLHQKRRIDLKDLAPGSIWISPIGTRFGRSTFHVGVRLRSRERCDFTLFVRSTEPIDSFLTDLRLMCVAADAFGETPLTPQFGGYWPEYDVATVERIQGESVEATIRFMSEHPDRQVRQRLQDGWKHLSWSALVAAFKFNRRTEGQWMFAGSVARDVSVGLEDFTESERIFPVAGWRAFEGSLEMILTLKHAFLDRIRFHHPALAPHTDDELLFAAAVEAFGLREGLAFLEDALSRARAIPAPTEETVELARRMSTYVTKVKDDGYMPRALCFAIARYHAWAKQVPDADVRARAAQLRELQHNYRIEAAARRFPGSRLWLYAETVLQDSPPEGRETIRQAIRTLRDGADIKEVLGRLDTDLQEKLPTRDQHYFLTRAAYPHLDVDEKAQLVATTEVGADRAELVTRHDDRFGRELCIRPAANSREVDTLQRIFYAGGIGGGLTVHNQFLVGVDPSGYVVGGVGYIRRTPNHTLLDKIAVLPRCRGRGIGRILVREFLRRQSAEGASIVSAEFIRESWLAQFGFRSNPRYAGVVRPLHEDE